MIFNAFASHAFSAKNEDAIAKLIQEAELKDGHRKKVPSVARSGEITEETINIVVSLLKDKHHLKLGPIVEHLGLEGPRVGTILNAMVRKKILDFDKASSGHKYYRIAR